MATLRVLPSLLNQPQNLVASPEITSKKRLSLGRLQPCEAVFSNPCEAVFSNHVKLCSPIRASLVPGLSDSDERGSREEFGVERCDGVGEESGGFLATGAVERFVRENARELAIGGLVFALVCLPDERALALGPGGPLMEEFWDNVRRYGFYFFTVVSGGLYSLTKPLLDLLKNPSTQILVLIADLYEKLRWQERETSKFLELQQAVDQSSLLLIHGIWAAPYTGLWSKVA